MLGSMPPQRASTRVFSSYSRIISNVQLSAPLLLANNRAVVPARLHLTFSEPPDAGNP